MRKLITTVLMMLFVTSLHAQWVSNFNSAALTDGSLEGAKGLAVSVDAYNNCYVTGYIYNTEGGNDILTIKYTSQGDTEWVKTYGGSANMNDQGNDILTDNSGNVYVIGTVVNSLTSSDIILLKYNSSGELLWHNVYFSSLSHLEDKGLKIKIDASANIFITGYTTGYDGYTDIVTRKYDTDGNVLWTVLEDGNDDLDARGSGIEIDSYGNACVTGYVTSVLGMADIAVLKYDRSGNLMWSQFYNGSGNSADKAFGIAVDDEDNIIIGGYITNDNEDCGIIKYNANGHLLWAASYNGSGNSADKAFGIAVDDEDRSIYITGYETDTYNSTNYITLKYNSSGNNEWAASYNGLGNGNDKANSIGIYTSQDNRKYVFITGESIGYESNMDYVTIQYDASNGSELRTTRYSMSPVSQDAAQDLAISQDGFVFITGYSELLIDAGVNSSYASTVMITPARPEEITANVPSKFALYQNYPNPFNPSTTIRFDIGTASQVKLEVFDMLGRSVAVLVDNHLASGSYSIPFSDSKLASGVYLYRLSAPGVSQIKKMTLIK